MEVTPEWQVSEDKKTADIGPVELNVTYKAPQNDKVTVTFTKLPEKAGNLTIKEIKLTVEEQLSLGALSDTAYDITSDDMENGTFEYNLTLPYPDKDNDGKAETKNGEVKAGDLQVLYTEGEGIKKEELKNAAEDENVDKITKKTDKVIELKGLDHFTIFIVAQHTGNMGTFMNWNYTDCDQGSSSENDYLILNNATSALVSPSMSLNNTSGETLNFKTRTYGGVISDSNVITISISTNNGSTWSILGTRIPAGDTLQLQSPFDLTGYNGTNVKIKMETLSAVSGKGVGIDDIRIEGVASPALTSTIGTVNDGAETITAIPNGTTLAAFKAAITPALGATFEVYQADGTTVAADLATGYKVKVTAEDKVTAKIYTVTVNLPAIGGTVAITGTAKYGELLTAIPSLTNAGTPTYQWNRGGAPISEATATTYTLAEADITTIITVTATAQAGVGTGSVTSSATGIIAKADGPALADVTINDTENTVTGMIAVMEFSTNGTDWTAYNAGTPNLPDLTGVVALQVRIAATATYEAGAATTFNFTVPSAAIVYVNASKSDSNDGLTAGNAKKTIQAGINLVNAGGTVNVAAGTYTENIIIDKSLTLMGVGDGTLINGNINATGDNVTIQSLKITNSNEHNGGVSDYGVKVTAGKALTLEVVTIAVSHDAVSMRSVSPTDVTTITINNSNIKGYAAIELYDPANSRTDTNANVNITVNNTSLTGTTSYGGGSNDFSTIGSDYVDDVHINFTGASSVANEYIGVGATSKERLIWFYYAGGGSVTGAPTYTNHADSTVSTDGRFMSSVGYTNTVAGQVVARYVTDSTEFETALAESAITPIVVGNEYGAFGTTKNNTLNTGATLRIEANSPVTINTGNIFTNNGTIILEEGATLTNDGTLQSASITGTATYGQLLTATITGLTGAGTPTQYQWKRGGVDIAGATASIYTLVSADIGTVITVAAKTDGIAGAGFITSAGTGVVAASSTVYVDASKSDTNNGLTADTAKKTIQAGINLVNAGGTVNVAAGDYTENLTIAKSLSLAGVGDDTHIIGNINTTGDNVTIQDLKITNSKSHDDGVSDFGIKAIAGKALTLENVTVDVLHNGVYMRSVSDTDPTIITINSSNIKGYAAIELADPAYDETDTNAAVSVNIEDTILTGTTSYGAGSNDYSTIGMDYINNVTVSFTGANTVANEYTGGATSKERLIWFYYADNNSVIGTIPTYTNHADSTVTDDALFMSSVGYTNTVEGKDVARYVVGSTAFETALASDATTIVVGGDYDPIDTTQDNTLNTGVTLIIEALTPVTITADTTLTNNGTIMLETGATLTNDGTIRGVGTVSGAIGGAGANLMAYDSALVAVTEPGYTTESWATYQGVVDANQVDSQTSQTAVDAATANITNAQTHLVTKLDAATAAVVAAEADPSESNLATANELVGMLPDSPDKTALENRITAAIFDGISAELVAIDVANNLGDVDASNIAHFPNLYFEKSVIINGVKTKVGKITFTVADGLDLSNTDTQTFLQNLGDYMKANPGSMKFDASLATQMKNAGAEIRMYGINSLGYYDVTSIIVKDDAGNILSEGDADYPILSAISYAADDGGTLIFRTNHFTQFELDQNQTTPDESGNATLSGDTTQVVLTDPDKNVTINIADGTEDPTIDVSAFVSLVGGEMTGTLPGITINSSAADVVIQDGTVVTGPADWDGIIDAPRVVTSAGTAPSGFAVGDNIIEIGSSDGVLYFDQAVKITLPGVTGIVAYKPAGSDVWTEITTQCNSVTDHSNISSPGECYFTDGADTIIWTYHFTSFGGLMDAQNPDNVTSLEAVYRPATKDVRITWKIKNNDANEVFIYRGTSKSFGVNSGSRIAKQDSNDKGYTDNNVTAGKTYYYKVVARDEAGNNSSASVIRIAIPKGGTTAAVSTSLGTEAVPAGTTLGVETNTEQSTVIEEPQSSNSFDQGTETTNAKPEVLGEDVQKSNQPLWSKWWFWLILLGVFSLPIWLLFRNRPTE